MMKVELIDKPVGQFPKFTLKMSMSIQVCQNMRHHID